VLSRRFGDFEAAEDAVQEALLASATQWPTDGVPANPRGWLIQVASRRMIEQVRGEQGVPPVAAPGVGHRAHAAVRRRAGDRRRRVQVDRATARAPRSVLRAGARRRLIRSRCSGGPTIPDPTAVMGDSAGLSCLTKGDHVVIRRPVPGR
jgi:DNA-directed RNA polymerase specialized sigma24 family protein